MAADWLNSGLSCDGMLSHFPEARKLTSHCAFVFLGVYVCVDKDLKMDVLLNRQVASGSEGG